MAKAGRVYLEIADRVLKRWHPDMTDDLREKLLSEGDYDLLEENFVHGHESISEAVISLRKSLKEKAIVLPRGFTDCVKYMQNNCDVDVLREEVGSLDKETQARIALQALSDIHDRWVRANSLSVFEDVGRYYERYMLMPLSLIGFETVRLDLVFLEPIIWELGMEISESDIVAAYVEDVVTFRDQHKLASKISLIDWIMNGLYRYQAIDAWVVRYFSAHYVAAAGVADQVIEHLRFAFEV